MTKLHQIYKCMVCGNIIEVVHESGGELVCCGQPMTLMQENTVDASHEKHVPVIEKIEGGVKILVGSIPHPMEEAHFIEWIEIMTENGKVYKKFLKPGDAPEAIFMVSEKVIMAREYCNLHGLWKSE